MDNSFFRFLVGLFLLAPGFLNAAKPVFLINPVQTAPAILYAGEVATAIYQVTNNTPFSLNSNGLINLASGVTQAVSAGTCTNPFNLSPGASCNLHLQVVADQMLTSIYGGPVVCNSLANPIYCSRPSTGNELQISKNGGARPFTRITTNSSVVNIPEGGVTEIIQISNQGTSIAYNIGATITAPALAVITGNNCPSFLVPGSSCQISVQSGASLGSTTVMISGTNTGNPIPVEINVVAATAATLSVSSPTAIIPVNVVSGISLMVTNTSTLYTAYNVKATLPVAWTDVAQDSSSCAVLPPNGSCTLTFRSTSTLPYVVEGNIPVTGDNISSPPTIAIAFSLSGYLVFDVDVATSIAKVVAAADTSSFPWNAAGSSGAANATSLTNGAYLDTVGNTYEIISGVDAIGPQPGLGGNAAAVCYEISMDNTGNTLPLGTWYLPAICDFTNSNTSCGPNTMERLYQFNFGGFSPVGYWSSTSASSTSAYYWLLTSRVVVNKDQLSPIRCVRALSY